MQSLIRLVVYSIISRTKQTTERVWSLTKQFLFCKLLLCAYIKRQLWCCCQFNRISPLMMKKIVFGSPSIHKQGGAVIENRISINPWLTFHWFPIGYWPPFVLVSRTRKKFINEESTKNYPWLAIFNTHCFMLQPIYSLMVLIGMKRFMKKIATSVIYKQNRRMKK